MTNVLELPYEEQDGITHINTHSKSKNPLGRILSPSYEIGEPIHHPILGPFRSVENMWCYLNTGGNVDKIRTMAPHIARNFMRLSDKYQCNKFRELILDATVLKLQTNSDWWMMMAEETLPFDNYYVNGKDHVIIRPSYSALYIDILNEAREVVRGSKEHVCVRFKDMEFTKIEEGSKHSKKK